MPEVGSGAIPSPHVSTAQWQSFEMRMRQRRASRLVARAQVALEQGQVADAEAALQEARTLDSAAPDLETMRAQIAPPSPVAPVAVTLASPPSRRLRLPIAIAASLVLVPVLAMWSLRTTHQAPALAEAPQVTTAPALAAVHENAAPPAAQVAMPLVKTAAADSIETKPPEPAPLAERAPLPERPPFSEPAPISTRPSPEEKGTPVPAVATVQPLRLEPVSDPPVRDGIEPAGAIVTPPAAPPPIAAPEVPAPPPAEPERVDEAPSVRRVLSQYEAAYSALDAPAAQRVWPSLDTRALSRAFEGLESQRVSLGDCRVSISGAGARADCRGSAQWTPKVGGGSKRTTRTWSFDLEKKDGAWKIVDAIVK